MFPTAFARLCMLDIPSVFCGDRGHCTAPLAVTRSNVLSMVTDWYPEVILREAKWSNWSWKAESGSGSGSASWSSSEEEGAVYRLRARRQLPVSYRAQEYDRLISSAIKVIAQKTHRPWENCSRRPNIWGRYCDFILLALSKQNLEIKFKEINILA